MTASRVRSIKTDVVLDRGLPCNVDAERCVLGAVLIEPSLFIQVAGVLETEDFSLEKHRRIFLRMGELYARAERIDHVTLANELMRQNQLDSVDGLTYLVELNRELPTVANIHAWVKIVVETSMLRTTMLEAQKLITEATLQMDPCTDLLANHIIRMQELSQRGSMGHSIEAIPTIAECGAVEIDYLIEPILYRGGVIALTGDAGCGKSTLANFFAGELASNGTPSLILDRENPRTTVAERLDRLGITDGPMFRYAGGWLRDGVPGPEDPSLTAWVKASKPKRPIIVIDSLSAFFSGDENDAAEMRRFMQLLRNLADLSACIVILHHDGKADTARDYRGSSDFKAAIDQGFHVSNFGAEGKLGMVKLRCYKSRLGFAGDIVYHYDDGVFIRGRGDAPVPSTEQFRNLLQTHPGISHTEFERQAIARGLGRDRARDWLGECVLAGTVRREPKPGKGGGHRYFPLEEALP